MKKIRSRMIGALVVLVLVFTGFSFNQPSAVAMSRDTVKYYTTVQVDAGDSLWSIAEEYVTPEYLEMDAYIEEIKTINGLRSDQIQQGAYLNIPYYASEEP